MNAGLSRGCLLSVVTLTLAIAISHVGIGYATLTPTRCNATDRPVGTPDTSTVTSTGLASRAGLPDRAAPVPRGARLVCPSDPLTGAITTAVDQTNDDVGAYISMALDSGGRPHVSYYDGTNANLKYATMPTTSWEVETVVDSSDDVGNLSSIRVDSNGDPHIAHYNQSTSEIVLTVKSGGEWASEIVDDLGSTPGYGYAVAMALRPSDDAPFVAYFDQQNGGIKLAWKVGPTWFYAPPVIAGAVIWDLAIDFDSSGLVHVLAGVSGGYVYAMLWDGAIWGIAHDLGLARCLGCGVSLDITDDDVVHTSFTGADGLMHAERSAAGTWSDPEIIDCSPALSYPSIRYEDVSQTLHVAYYDGDTEQLKYAVDAGSGWQLYHVETIGPIIYAGNFTALDLVPGSPTGAGAGALPRIAYYDGTGLDVRFAHSPGTLSVGDDFPTIQGAIDASFSADAVQITVLGTYSGPGNRDLDFGGRTIALDGLGSTIDCGGGPGEPHQGLYFHSGESRDAIVRNLTIMNGETTGALEGGGGIRCIGGSSPSIIACVIANNSADGGHGGGVACTSGASPLFQDCEIIDNLTNNSGGGIQILHNGTDPEFNDCRISGNTAAGRGGGIACLDGAEPLFVRCVITGNLHSNATFAGGGGVAIDGSNPIFSSCTISDNRSERDGGGLHIVYGALVLADKTILWNNCAAGQGDEAFLETGTALSFVCSDVDDTGITGGGILNLNDSIAADPMFCDPIICAVAPASVGTYTIAGCGSSPCLPENSPCAEQIGALGPDCSPSIFPNIRLEPLSLDLSVAAGETVAEMLTINAECGALDLPWQIFPIGDAAGAAPLHGGRPVVRLGSHDGQAGEARLRRDAFGYIFADSLYSPLHRWREINTIGTQHLLGNDDAVLVQLPFAFPFYGEQKTEVWVSSNGFLTFSDAGASAPNNVAFPNPALPNDVIAALWDDLDPSFGGGAVYTHHDATLHEFIIEYDHVFQSLPLLSNTFQIVLRSNGTILFQYFQTFDFTGVSTIGIENADGSIGLTVMDGSVAAYQSVSTLIYRECPWLTATPVSGSMPPETQEDLTITVDATSLAPGQYERDLMILSGDEDLDQHITIVPVSVTVTGITDWADVSGMLGPADDQVTSISWPDADGDGDADLYLGRTGASRLFRNDGGGDLALETPAALAVTGVNDVAWADYDNDGDLDLYVTRLSLANQLLRNDGTGDYVDVAGTPMANVADKAVASWADADLDGDLDLFVGLNATTGDDDKLFRNDGNDSFHDWLVIPGPDYINSGDVSWGDYDNDGDADLFIANRQSARSKLLRNDLAGNFVNVIDPQGTSGLSGPSVQVIRTAGWGDFDEDGWFDLYLGRWSASSNQLFRNLGDGTFENVATSPLNNAGNAIGMSWGDADLDGDLDLFLTNWGAEDRLFRNDGGGGFASIEFETPEVTSTFGMALADYDSDGDLDLAIGRAAPDSVRLFRNDQQSGNEWLQVKLVGTVSNENGVGARVRVTSDGIARERELGDEAGGTGKNSLPLEFGLATGAASHTVLVQWPSGTVQESLVVVVDQAIELVEPEDIGVADQTQPPLRFRVAQNVPNPFNPITEIRYDLPVRSRVTLAIFDAAGREVRRLLQATPRDAGRHVARWDGKNEHGSEVASGVYFYRFETDGFQRSRRMVLLR